MAFQADSDGEQKTASGGAEEDLIKGVFKRCGQGQQGVFRSQGPATMGHIFYSFLGQK